MWKQRAAPAVFRRNIMTFQFLRWFLRLGKKLREQLAPLPSRDNLKVEQWLAKLFEGEWLFPLSRKGCACAVAAPHTWLSRLQATCGAGDSRSYPVGAPASRLG